jgi:hypothetical protein
LGIAATGRARTHAAMLLNHSPKVRTLGSKNGLKITSIYFSEPQDNTTKGLNRACDDIRGRLTGAGGPARGVVPERAELFRARPG